MDTTNRFIVSNLVRFNKVNPNIVGTCEGYCTLLLDALQTDKQASLNFVRLNENEAEIFDNTKKMCTIRKVQGIVVFESMQDFTHHSEILYNSVSTMSDEKQTFITIPSYAIVGTQFEYKDHGLIQNTNISSFGVGFQHYVLEVKSTNGECYLLDPTVGQFHDKPTFFLLPEFAHIK